MRKRSITEELRSGIRKQGSELRKEDIDKNIGDSFGRVLPIDVGKRVWLQSYGLIMENNGQRDSRKQRS